MNKSVLKSSRVSPLQESQPLKVGGEQRKKHKADLAVALPLTSLIDAFCIIVIYLLIGTQSGGTEVQVSSQIELPTAESGLLVEKETPTVRIEKGLYFINDQIVATNQLGEKLNDLRKTLAVENPEILIQADQKMDYAELDPLIRAGSEAGIQRLKFAVVPSK